jgi:hypothetical protein
MGRERKSTVVEVADSEEREGVVPDGVLFPSEPMTIR